MGIKQLAIYFAVGFLGYAIGRVSHIVGGMINGPHHWIYGVLLVIAGVVLWFYKKEWSLYLIFFGLGLAISDLKDMIGLKLWGVDEPGVKRFWGID